jgi:hypothetical protein
MYPVSFRSDTYQQTWKNMKQAPKEEKTQNTQTNKTYENENRGN